MALVFARFHYPHVLNKTARADWFEVILENFMITGGRPLQLLEKTRELAPVAFMSVRSTTASLPGISFGSSCRASRADPPGWSWHLGSFDAPDAECLTIEELPAFPPMPGPLCASRRYPHSRLCAPNSPYINFGPVTTLSMRRRQTLPSASGAKMTSTGTVRRYL